MAEIPEFLRRAMEAQGKVDPDAPEFAEAVAVAAEEIERPEPTPAPTSEEATPPAETDIPEPPSLLDPLPDPDENRLGRFSDPAVSGAPETQRQAAVLVYPETGSQRRRVLDAIVDAADDGMTDDELERGLGLRHQTASARRNELAADGWIEDSGRRRPTSSGRDAAVWILTEAGSAQWRRARAE